MTRPAHRHASDADQGHDQSLDQGHDESRDQGRDRGREHDHDLGHGHGRDLGHDHGHGHDDRHQHRLAVRRPGRPRSEAAEKAIVESILDLLAEGVPYGVLTVEQIAGRAGVGKATIYRRWANKEALVIHALASFQEECGVPDFTDGRSIRELLVAVLDVIHKNATGDRSGMVFSTVMAEGVRHPDFARKYQETAIEPRRDIVRAILREGIARGELRPDLDVERALRMISSPMLMYVKFERPGGELPEGFIEGLVDDLLLGFAPR